MPTGDEQRIGPLEALEFGAELVLLAVLAVAGARLPGSTAASIALAVALPLATAIAWGLLLAPRARRRLDNPVRLAAKLLLVAAAAILLAASGLLWWAAAFLVAAAALFVRGETSA